MKKLKKIRPMFNRIITTADTYDSDQIGEGGLIDPTKSRGTMKEYQTVVSVGNTVRDIKEGDIVCIDFTRYMVVKHNDKSIKNNVIGDAITLSYNLNTVTLNDKMHLMLYDQDISYVVLDSEEVPDTPSKIITPEKPKLIV